MSTNASSIDFSDTAEFKKMLMCGKAEAVGALVDICTNNSNKAEDRHLAAVALLMYNPDDPYQPLPVFNDDEEFES